VLVVVLVLVLEWVSNILIKNFRFFFNQTGRFSGRRQRSYETPLARNSKRLNVEHRTSNIERRMLMTLRFIYFKASEPQPATISSVVGSGANDSAESNFEG